MDFIRGLFTLVVIGIVIWAANAFFDAVGGWPGVIATVVGVVAITVAGGRYFSRKAERAELEEMPGQVRALIEDAQKLFGDGGDALSEANIQFEEKRGPLFWDKIYECNDALMRCAGRLERARKLTDDYNHRAPMYDLTDPKQIEPLSRVAYDDTMALVDEMSDLAYQAMAVPEFGVIYEQRRQAERVLDGQRAVQSDIEALATKTRQAVNAATTAVQAAESARMASKRAAGDWF